MSNIITNISFNGSLYNQILPLLAILFAGSVVGVFFFLGLHWTIKKAMQSPSPALWFFSSFLLRTSVTLAAVYLLTDNQWPRLLACMLGFVGARFAVVILTRPATVANKKQEPHHAP